MTNDPISLTLLQLRWHTSSVAKQPKIVKTTTTQKYSHQVRGPRPFFEQFPSSRIPTDSRLLPVRSHSAIVCTFARPTPWAHFAAPLIDSAARRNHLRALNLNDNYNSRHPRIQHHERTT